MSHARLGDDMYALMQYFKENPLVTKAQRARYHGEGKVRAVTQPMLGTDPKPPKEPLCLLEEDGHDGLPVGSMSYSSATCFFDYNDHHVFPPQRDLVRFGVAMHLDLYGIVALALKGAWEHHFGHDVKGYRTNTGKKLRHLLDPDDEQDLAAARSSFRPPVRELFKLLEEHGGLASAAGYDLDTLRDQLVREMIINDLDRRCVAHDAPDLMGFVERLQTQRQLAAEGTQEQQEAFWRHKCRWLDRRYSLGQKLLQLDGLRLRHAEIERCWLVCFGQQELALQEQLVRLCNLDRRVLLKQARPDLTQQELDRQVAREEEQQRQRLSDLRFKAAVAPHMERSATGGVAVDDERLRRHREECIRLLTRIRRLTHPDQLPPPPNDARLTTLGRVRPRGMWTCSSTTPTTIGSPRSSGRSWSRSCCGPWRSDRSRWGGPRGTCFPRCARWRICRAPLPGWRRSWSTRGSTSTSRW